MIKDIKECTDLKGQVKPCRPHPDSLSLSLHSYPNCVYLSVADQKALGFRLTSKLPVRSYTRKNIGYLYAILHGATVIYDTVDDSRSVKHPCALCEDQYKTIMSLTRVLAPKVYLRLLSKYVVVVFALLGWHLDSFLTYRFTYTSFRRFCFLVIIYSYSIITFLICKLRCCIFYIVNKKLGLQSLRHKYGKGCNHIEY